MRDIQRSTRPCRNVPAELAQECPAACRSRQWYVTGSQFDPLQLEIRVCEGRSRRWRDRRCNWCFAGRFHWDQSRLKPGKIILVERRREKRPNGHAKNNRRHQHTNYGAIPLSRQPGKWRYQNHCGNKTNDGKFPAAQHQPRNRRYKPRRGFVNGKAVEKNQRKWNEIAKRPIRFFQPRKPKSQPCARQGEQGISQRLKPGNHLHSA